MTRLLAPSNLGYKGAQMPGYAYWGVKPSAANIRVSGTPNVLAHYKGPTTKTVDHVKPTNYVRMISRVIPGGDVDCGNNIYSYKSDFALTVGVNPRPNGCDIPNGSVKADGWMTDQVLTRCLEQMSGIAGNIYEDLGQLMSTGEEILEIFTTICKLYRDARKGFWWKIRRALRTKGINIPRHIANGWLMYFYGIKPLVSTIGLLCEGQKPRFRNFKAKSRLEVAVSPARYTNAGWWVQFTGTAKVQTQAKLFARLKLSGNLEQWQRLGVTDSAFNDAVVTAWALYPFSFVVDWIIPVEAWLRTRVWAPFLEYQGGYTGIRHDVKADYTDDWPWSGQRPYVGQLPHGRVMVRFYKRTTYPYVVPTPALNIRLALNGNQIASAVALAIK